MRTLSTQKKIAQKLGVSTATVSRTLNDLPGVSDDVRARILKVASELEYRPNLPGRSLATSVTQTAAFVVHETNHIASEDPFYPVIMAGAQAYLAEHNYHILLTTLDDRTMERPQAFPVVSEKRVDGLILAGPEISTPFILAMQSAGIPVVLVDNCLSQTPINCVLNDDEGSAHEVTRHLLDHGHNRIGFLSGPQEWTSNRERGRGYEHALHEAGLEPLIIYGSRTTIETGQTMTREALDRWPDLTAIFGVNDSVAIGAMRSASELGRHTPDDLAVFGFDDISWAALNQPPLSTVHVYKRRIGQLAAQCLLDSIAQPEAAPARTAVAAKLVLRASCGHAA